MPTYDYQCSTCGTDFELFQSFSEDTLKKCPTRKSGRSPAACLSPGKGKVTKVFSAPGITFKGSGFYKTDSRSTPSDSSGSSDSSSSSSDSSSSSSDSSSKSSDTSDKKSSDSSDSSSKKSSDSSSKSTTSKSSD